MIFGLLVPIQLCEEQSLDVLLVVIYVAHLDIKKWQIYQKIDALKHHHWLNVEWICLELLLSDKKDQIWNDIAPYSFALQGGLFT